jgi:transposase
MGTPTTPRRPYLVVASVTTKGGRRGTVGVDKMEDMHRRARRGESVAGNARAEGVSEPTAGKYVRMGDLSPEPPRAPEPESPTLAPHEATIDSWPGDDRSDWRKQRHAAVRVYVRLREEEGREGSRPAARRRAGRRREEMAAERDARDAAGYLELSWLPGECQVDFGEADSGAGDVTTRGHRPAASFPHSNVGPARVFWGETSECVCQGPGNVSGFVGGVPRRAVFDNATEVGRRVGDRVLAGDLLGLFAAHYGLDRSSANPRSGNEKGNAGDKVGRHRRNLFVPVPSFHDAGASDARLLDSSLAPGDGKPHHGRGVPEPGLFEEDRSALSPLPDGPFSCAGRPARRAS